MYEYGRKPYITKNYREMMKITPNKTVWNKLIEKHSEFEKPYLRDTNYDKMQFFHPVMPGLSPWRFDFDKWDFPSGIIPNDASTWRYVYSFPGCDFEFPGLFASINRCETKCEVLDDDAMWADGTPKDPIVKWEAKNGVITESDMFHACVRANEDVPYGQRVELIATTKSGETCEGFAWVEGDDCEEECDCTDISIGYTTQQMAIDEVQTLSVTGAVEGCTYDWAIASGGGSLSSGTGTSVDYTAPSTNAECANNPTITLSTAGNTCDSLDLAVTTTSDGLAAAQSYCVGTLRYCKHYSCDNTLVGNWAYCNAPTPELCLTDTCYWALCPLAMTDMRSDAQKTAGCCPVALL